MPLQVTILGPQTICVDCTPITAVPTPANPPSSNSYTYAWSNGATTATITICSPGTYTVTVTDANGQSASATHTLYIVPFTPLDIVSDNTAPCNDPDSSFTNPGQLCERVCPNTTVTYSAQAFQGPITGQPGMAWSVSGALSWAVQNPPFNNAVTVTWGAPGTGSVKVSTDAAGGQSFCSGADELCVTIVEAPVAAFTAAPAPAGDTLEVCRGQTVYLQNQSQAADSYDWFFPDNSTTASTVNAEHTFQSTGTYTVRLIARSDCLCADTTELTVVVLDADAPAIDCAGTVCPGATVTYTASQACPPYAWNVSSNGTILGGGTAASDTVSVQWNDGPYGVVSLGAQPCSGAVCPSATTLRVPVISDNAEIEGRGRVCPNALEDYRIEAYGGTNFTWTLSGGGTIVAGQNTARVQVKWTGTTGASVSYWLVVTYDNCYLGCGGRDSIAVRVLPAFILDGPAERCAGSTAPLNARLSPSGALFPANWTVYGPGGVAVWNSPAAAGTVNVALNAGAGQYRVFATPADSNQTCTDRAEWALTAAAPPAPATGIDGPTLVCLNTPYTYKALGLPPGASVRWTLQGAAGPAVQAGTPLNVTWTGAGPHRLVLQQISTDGLGCLSDTVQLDVAPPSGLLVNGPATLCVGNKGQYLVLGAGALDVQWTVSPAGAGVLTSGQGTDLAEIYWQQTGTHTVTATACGVAASVAANIQPRPTPMVQYPANLCSGATATATLGQPYSVYSWRSASGSVLSVADSVVVGPGSYFVAITDANGCTAAREFTIATDDSPNVSLTTADFTGFCNNASFVLLTALVDAGGSFTYQWRLNGVPIPGATNADYATNQYGAFTVVATNASGCSAVSNPIVTFNYCGGGGGGGGFPGGGLPPCPPGSADLTATAAGTCNTFGFQASGADYLPGSAQWTFGISGGTLLGTASGDNTAFTFPNAGKYLVIVELQLQSGGSCELIDSVAVAAAAEFTPDPACAGASTSFDNTSTFVPGPGVTASGWQWNFGDPASGAANTSSLENPGHTFTAAGVYTVTLVVTAPGGCTASATATLNIPGGTAATFAPPPVTCAGAAVPFSTSPGNNIVSLGWNFGDVLSGAANMASGTLVYHQFSGSGNYTITMTSTNAYGCTSTSTQPISIAPNALAGTITPANPAPLCEGATAILQAPAGAASYQWSDGVTSGATLTTGEEGSYSVTLTDVNGCTYVPPPVALDIVPDPDALIKAVLENSLGQVIGYSWPTIALCAGDPLHLVAQGNGTYTYVWSGNNGTGTNLFFNEARDTLLPVGVHTFSVTVTDIVSGCTAVSDPFVVTVNPRPPAPAIVASGVCAGSSTTLSYSGPTPPNWQFVWNNGDIGTSTVADEYGAYYLRVINEFGCENRGLPVDVLPGPPVAAVPGGCHQRCRPDTLCIGTVPAGTTWQWFFNGAPLAGATSAGLVADSSGTYYAVLTDATGCSAQSDPLTLSLYDGVGTINGQVWSDVNGNGTIDAADTLVSGITVNLWQNGAPAGSGLSDGSGAFAFVNIPADPYSVQIDPGALPPNWQIVIGQDDVALAGCGALAQARLLLRTCVATVTPVGLSACFGDEVVYNGVSIPAGASVNFYLTSAVTGCDSIVEVTVQELPVSFNQVTVTACAGETIFYNGTGIAAGQSQFFTYQNSVGCDSIVNVQVNTFPASPPSALNVSVCSGQSYFYSGTLIPAGQSATVAVPNQWGCDSLVTVNVAAFPVPSTTVEATVCPDETFVFQGIPIAAWSSQTFTLIGPNGCDSLVTVNVGAWPEPATSLNATVCPGETYLYQGAGLAPGTVQSFVFTSVHGCDSTVTVSVDSWPPAASALNVQVCPGETFAYQGVAMAPGNTQTFMLTGAHGCDSLVSVAVTAWPTAATALDVRICDGETYSYQGFTLPVGAVQAFTLQTVHGCDSIVTVSVGSFPVWDIDVEVQVCPGETYAYQGVELAPGAVQSFLFQTAEGCDSTVTVSVTAFPQTTFGALALPACPGTATGSIEVVNVAGGVGPWRYSIDGGATFQDTVAFTALDAGDYTILIEDVNGCTGEQDVEVPARAPLGVVLSDAVLACDSAQVVLAPVLTGDTVSVSLTWWNGATGPATAATEAGPVWVEATNACATVRREAQVQWQRLASNLSLVYVPNSIAPEARYPDNDRFRVSFADGVEVLDFHLEVYDRWGELHFRTDDFGDGWKGPFRAQSLEPAVFVWWLRARVAFCGRELELFKKGDVTVVR